MRALLKELRRRRIFRTAALYIVGAWLVVQAADVLFPAWGIPDAAINFLLIAAIAGFPVAMLFGWLFDVSSDGIRRTKPADADERTATYPLRQSDYLILTVFITVAGLIIYNTVTSVVDAPRDVGVITPAVEKIENSIAVLPFANMSSDPENEYFADGISDEILIKLGEFRDLHVIGRTSSFAFKNSGFDIPKLSSLLGVRFLLQGTVRKDGNQLRISTQLVDDSGVQLWSTAYDRELEGIFAIQKDIAESVAREIAPHLAAQRIEESPRNVEAYQHYLIGREYAIKRVNNYWKLVPEQFERAIEIDPKFAEPYAELAIFLTLTASGSTDFDDAIGRAQQAIDTALSLKPDLARALAAQALLLDMSTQPVDYPRVEGLLRKSLALDPTSMDTHNWLAGNLNQQGRIAEALAVSNRALGIDPLSPSLNVNAAGDEMEQGDFEKAERRLLRMLELPQPSYYAYFGLFDLYFITGRLVAYNNIAKRRVLNYIETSGDAWSMNLARNYAYLGMWELSEYWYTRSAAIQLEGYRGGNIIGSEVLQRQGRYAQMVDYYRAELEAKDQKPGDLGRVLGSDYGAVLALSGDYIRAIQTLELFLDPDSQGQGGPADDELRDGFHALAWAYLQTGDKGNARRITDAFELRYLELEGRDSLHKSSNLFGFALNTLLAGDRELGLDRFRQAVDAGWRDYYSVVHDPRWESVRDNPRFKELMADVKTDLDVQRARVEEIEAEHDFVARVERTLAVKQSESQPLSN